MIKELDSVELARIEFEKDLEDDPNNEWLKRVIKGLKMAEQSLQHLEQIGNVNPSEALKCLNFLKNETINDIACLKDSVTTKTLYQLYFANFDSIEQALFKAQEMEKENKQLEEQIGCPLEVREQALKQGFIYNGFTKLLYICCRYDEGGCYLTNSAVKFYLKDYKKKFWLKEDRSE